jgi:hypothetical protein
LDRRLSGPQSRAGRGGDEKKFQPCRESNSGFPARGLDTIWTELLWLSLLHALMDMYVINDLVSTAQSYTTELNGKVIVNDQYVGIWEETVVAYLKILT